MNGGAGMNEGADPDEGANGGTDHDVPRNSLSRNLSFTRSLSSSSFVHSISLAKSFTSSIAGLIENACSKSEQAAYVTPAGSRKMEASIIARIMSFSHLYVSRSMVNAIHLNN